MRQDTWENFCIGSLIIIMHHSRPMNRRPWQVRAWDHKAWVRRPLPIRNLNKKLTVWKLKLDFFFQYLGKKLFGPTNYQRSLKKFAKTISAIFLLFKVEIQINYDIKKFFAQRLNQDFFQYIIDYEQNFYKICGKKILSRHYSSSFTTMESGGFTSARALVHGAF